MSESADHRRGAGRTDHPMISDILLRAATDIRQSLADYPTYPHRVAIAAMADSMVLLARRLQNRQFDHGTVTTLTPVKSTRSRHIVDNVH